MASDGEYITLNLVPTINKDDTKYKAEGEWTDSNLIRVSQTGRIFRYPGWQNRLAIDKVIGFARDIHAWTELEDTPHYAVASNEKIQIERFNSLFDITPVEDTETGTDLISTTASSNEVLLVLVGHNRDIGDWIYFDSVEFPVGGVDFNGLEGQVIQVIDGDTVLLRISQTASSTEALGGGDTDLLILLSSGRQSTGIAFGYGANTYGTPGATPTDGWGDPRGASSLELDLRQWSLDNWGEDLIAVLRGGAAYHWDASTGVQVRMQEISTAPDKSLLGFVHPNRHLVLLGTVPVGSSDLDPMEIRWSDRDSFTSFNALPENRAGSYRLQGTGNQIVGYAHSRRETIILTDDSVWSMAATSNNSVFGFNQLSTNTGLIAPHGVVDVDGVVYWMGFRNFYKYDGRVTSLANNVEDFVFSDLDFRQKDKIFCAVNKSSQEIMWLYQSTDSPWGDVNKYVKHNWVTGSWDVGELDRTVWVDSGIFTNPIAVSGEGFVYTHEIGDAYPGRGNTSSFIESSYFDLQDGTDLMFLDMFVPDLVVSGAVDLYVTMRKWPNGPTVTKGPYSISPSTKYVNLRCRGRQAKIRFEANADYVTWSLGKPLYRVKADGRR